ncbi:MAG: hypothetical protein V2B19_12220 [Pseudomonadota bacterium]
MFDYSLNHYHPEKDREPGAYEWWYTDADLDNGYTLNITFFHTDFTGPRYKEFLYRYAAAPNTPYNALDYANVKMSLSDAEGKLLFFGDRNFTADQVKIALDRVEASFGDNCHITTRQTGPMPELLMDVEITDGNGNLGKAEVVFSPIVEGVKIGRGANMDTVVDGKHLYHKWIVAMPTAKVRVHLTITDSQGKTTEVNQTGFGYHDHNWGNHPLTQTLDRWYWGRIAEPDMTVIYAKVWNLVPSYPMYKPCIFTHDDHIISSTEGIDLIENGVLTGLQGLRYTTEPTVRFLEGSGVKGEIRISNLEFLSELSCYLRFSGDYDMDVETKYRRIKRQGKTIFEYMDLSESVRRAKAAS